MIADPNLAVAEFVKNAYDAGASEVHLDFRIQSSDVSDHVITITDNGVGMTEAEFRANWMRPGYSAKAGIRGPRDVSGVQTGPEKTVLARTPIGEKGLGRLAAGRLGEILEVFTRKQPSDPWLHVRFDWRDFDKLDIPLADVTIPYDTTTEPPLGRVSSGTIVHIGDLTINWAGRIPGRKVKGRSDLRLGRLRQDLAILVEPMSPTAPAFQIVLHIDAPPHLSQLEGVITSTSPGVFDYVYEFSYKHSDQGVLVTRTLRRDAEIAKLVGQDDETTETAALADLVEYGHAHSLEARPDTFACGTFRGRFFYFTRQQAVFAGSNQSAGVFLYRDGMRVDPYGHEEDDWLGLRARKASRQGYAAIQPKFLTGSVDIAKDANPDLIDMSNRQGLVENRAYEDFLSHLRAEVRHFERLIYDEWVAPGWRSREEQARDRVRQNVEYGVVALRDVVHSLRQPVTGLAFEVRRLLRLAKDRQVPPTLRDQFVSIAGGIQNHLETIEAIVSTMIDTPLDAEPQLVSLDSVVEAALERVRPLAKSLTVGLRANNEPGVMTLAPNAALTNAIASVLRNAVEAAHREALPTGAVMISSSLDDSQPVIRVSDNGPGIDADTRSRLFSEAASTKGRPGGGLIIVKALLASFGASIDVESSGPAGTVVRIGLVTVEGRRRPR